MTFHRRSSSLKKIVNYCMSLTAVRYLLLGQRDTWTLELCCLESPVNKWWNLRTRNRKVRVVTQIISRVFLKQKLKKVISPRQGVSSKGVTRDWPVPFLVFIVFSLGFAWFFFQKRYLFDKNMSCLWMLPFEVLWISGFHEFNSSSLVRQATICPLPAVTFKLFPLISKSCTF